MKSKIRMLELLYDFSIILIVIRTIISNSVFEAQLENIDIISVFFIIVLLFAKLLKQKYKIKELILIFIGGMISFYISYITGKYVVAMSYLALLSLKDVKIDRVIKIIFYTTSIFLTFLIIIYLLNLIFAPDSINIYLYYKGKPRHSFYMNHPNMFAGMIFWCLCGYVYICRNKFKIKTIIILAVVTTMIYAFTKSRTLVISVLFLIVLMLFYNIDNKIINSIIKWFAKYGFIILTILFLIIVQYYSELKNSFKGLLDILDILMSKRLSMGVAIKNIYGFSILPQKVNYNIYIFLENSKIKFALDNIYLNCAIVYGLLETVILEIIFYFGNKKSNRITNYFSVLMLINGITESYILNFIIAFPMLLLGNAILNKKKSDSDKDERRNDIYNNTNI